MEATIKSFTDLKVWQDSHNITVQVYKITNQFPTKEKYSLSSQICRASSSIGANIAEGFGRFHYKDKIRFFQNARGSAFELQNHFYLARDLGYIDSETVSNLSEKINEVIMEINGLIRSMAEKLKEDH